MTLLQAIWRSFKLGDTRTPAGRALLVEQFRILTSQVPVLYGVLIIDSISIAFVLPRNLPVASRFAVPVALLVVSAWRMIHWTRLRSTQLGAGDALRLLTKARALSSAINIAFSAWALSLFGTLSASSQAPLALLVFIGAVSSAYCLASVPSMARLTLLFTALPISLRMLFTGDPLLVCIGVNLCLTLGLLLLIMNTYSRDLVKLVASRARMAAARERSRRANAVALCEHAKAAEIAARFDSALNNMSQGLCFFDGDQKLIVCNRRYLDMYGLPPDSVKPGTTLKEIVALRFASGSCPAMSADAFLRWRSDLVATEQPSESIVELTNGRVFQINHQPMPDNGWVATHEDITARYRADQAVAAARANAERAERTARAAHATLVDALDVIPEGIAIFDADDRLVLWNRRYTDLYQHVLSAGMTFEDILKAGIARGQYPGAQGREAEWLRERMEHHAAPQSTHEHPLPGERWVRVEERRTASGGSIGVRVDITDLKRSEASFRILFEENPLPMWVVDVSTLELLAVNAATCRHYGYPREKMLTMTVEEIRHPDEREVLRAEFRQHKGRQTSGTRRHVTADGKVIEVAIEARPLNYNGREAAVAVAFDMTDRIQAEQRIKHLACHDTLTDLPNRAAFDEHLSSTLAEAASGQLRFAVLCIDLDRFKEINDLFGHSMGDVALREASRRLREAAGRAFVARVGGDEFIAVTTQEPQPASAELLATRLRAALEQDIVVDGHNLELDLSLGIAVYPRDGEDAHTLLANADAALYRAKHDGRGAIRFFTAAMDQQLRDRRALEHDLKSAVANGELSLAYQPQRRSDGRIIGFEALARWDHPQRGAIAPSTFIPIAEESGLIVDLGEWVLREACREAATWPRSLQLAVNISAVQFRRGDLQQTVQAVLQETGIAATQLELEITEGVLIESVSRTALTLDRLKALGVRIALDDFGTGYSSLSYLQSFPLDRIKIDRSFVSNLGRTENALAIVRAVIGLAHGLGLPVLAEGVETAAQLALLAAEGCDATQGFFIGRPQPIAAYAEILGDASIAARASAR